MDSTSHWSLDPEFHGNVPLNHGSIALPFDQSCEIFLFTSSPDFSLSNAIGRALAQLLVSLRNPPLLPIRSVILSPGTKKNALTNEPLHGRHCTRSRAIILYPQHWPERSCYPDGTQPIAPSWVMGVPLHEAAHLWLESHLLPLWLYHHAELGWRETAPNQWIQEKPEHCPTRYAATSPSEDLAESVVAFVHGWLQDARRARILSQFLLPSTEILERPAYRVTQTRSDEAYSTNRLPHSLPLTQNPSSPILA